THRMTLPEGDALPSITEIYPSGFVYENELHDIFKITVVSKSAASLDVHPRKLITFPFAFNSKYGARTCQNK
ncbi:MAG: NADH-quinone oxidoreductase subunit C, partial [Methanoregulaceae archaeon]|nr:NADH-quinone oxidoreductase subunit C [Methanoregulaceae archaeon]